MASVMPDRISGGVEICFVTAEFGNAEGVGKCPQ